MRISTSLLYQQAVANMQRQQAGLGKMQQQLSLGTRLVSPSDDPVAASRVLIVEQARATNEQYGVNRNSAKSALGLEEATLASVTTLLQHIRTQVVYAGNPTLTNADRAMLATELRARFQELLALANTTDGEGTYLFSGHQGHAQPFSGGVGGVSYNGDQGQRLVQVSPTRQLPVNDSGIDVFVARGTGNAGFYESAAGGNRGTGVIGEASVTNAALLSRTNPPTVDSYAVRFANPPTTFDVVNTTTGAVVAPAGRAYTSGAPIDLGGLSITISGAPAAGDEFTVRASKPIFDALSDFIAALEAPISDPAGSAALGDAVRTGLANVDQALDRVLAVRDDVGARLQELDSLDDLGDNTALQHDKTLSDLRDLDYAAAISDFTRQQMILEAAQRSFTRIAGLSLFDYL